MNPGGFDHQAITAAVSGRSGSRRARTPFPIGCSLIELAAQPTVGTSAGGLSARHRKKAQLRKIRIHDLRRTFAALLIQNREPIAYVQQQLGHASIRMTVDTYTHWVPGENREAVDKLPALGG